ncbi:chromate transporter [Mycoplasma sp. P36-A1]|uniref:chromate transporter n=1 Tax=Mycoplasma sp. P36-A1 TaxID=3252900 RepID=UPI003C2C64CA
MLSIFTSFLKIGFLGFGGGYAMLSLIFEESSKFGMNINDFADMNALDGIIPGPIAINSATFVGYTTGGLLMALVTTLAVCIPSFIFVPLYIKYESKIKNNAIMSEMLNCIKASSVGLILAVAFTLMISLIFNNASLISITNISIEFKSLFIILGVIFLHLKYEINPLLLIIVSGLVGIFLF